MNGQVIREGQPGYRICTRCVMDTTDPGIEFDAQGVCNRCKHYELLHSSSPVPREGREQALAKLVEQIRKEGRGKDYDCIIGVSGGVDSTYVAYTVKRTLGLRPLAVHLDNGWDAELAVSNIEKTLKVLEIDLYTCVLDWDEFRDIQLAFLKASTPDSEAPTDHAINAILRIKAGQEGVRFILNGSNLATEGIAVPTWSCGQQDWKYIRALHKRFGTVPVRSFPHLTMWDEFWYRYVRRQKSITILDYIDYHKEEAVEVLKRELGWQPYHGKHHESVYTRFYQSYILPKKFGFDKRKIHLSGLIMSGQITRDQALAELKNEIMPAAMIRDDKIFVAKKFGLTEQQFDEIMALPVKRFLDYPSYERSLPIRIRRAVVRSMRMRRAERSAAIAHGASAS